MQATPSIVQVGTAPSRRGELTGVERLDVDVSVGRILAERLDVVYSRPYIGLGGEEEKMMEGGGGAGGRRGK